jgi:DNA-binding winged helix-turn-helix (wHTH) protein
MPPISAFLSTPSWRSPRSFGNVTTYSFGAYSIDTDRMLVTGPEGPLSTEPQVFDVLLYIVRQNGRLVTKNELLDNVWGDRFVSESALTTRIKQARRLVGDDGQQQSAIRTIRGRGFRFMHDVSIEPSDDVRHSEATGGHDERNDDFLRAMPARCPVGLPRELDVERAKPFVGRHDEVERAVAVLGRHGPETSAWILLLGEPGIGKTRLAARLAELAQQRGATIIFGQCSEDLAVPFQPVIEALRSAIGDLAGNELGTLLGPGANELARLLPDILRRIPDLRRPEAADAETERYRLFEAVISWLESMSLNQRVVLAVDDAHWATSSTVQLLGHLSRRLTRGNVTILVTARDTAPDLKSGLRDLISAIEQLPSNEVIRLGGLDALAALELVGDRADADTVVAQTAGNPLLIQALVGSDDGNLGIDAAVHRRMAKLDRSVQDVLVVAAMVGLEFDLKVVAAVLDRNASGVIDDLDTAVNAHLLDDVGLDTYRFTHALVRATLRHDMSSPRRARWHGHIATALEMLYPETLDAIAPVLAYHYAEASTANPALRDVAIGHLRTAARRAAEQLSYSEAIDLLQRARALTAPTDLNQLATLALLQGDAETNAGFNVLAMRSFDSAFGNAVQANRPDLMAQAALRYEDASWRPGRSGGSSIQRLSAALAAIGPTDEVTRARLLIALTRAHNLAGDVIHSDEAYSQAETLINRLDDPLLETRALSARLSGHVDAVPPPPRASVVRLRALCDQVDNVEVELLARQLHMRCMIRFGEMDDYRRGFTEMSAIIDGIHSSFWEYVRANLAAMAALYEGDLWEAEAASARCANVAKELIEEDTSGTLGLRMFVIRREQDRLGHLAPLIRQLVVSGATTSFWTPGLALLLCEIGFRGEAADMLSEFSAQGFDLPCDAMWSTVMTMLIELATALGDLDSCEQLYARFAHQQGLAIVTGHGIVCFGAGDRYLGMLAATLGDLRSAEAHLFRAVEFDHRNGGTLWANHARYHLSEVHRRQGRTSEADALRAAVRSTARERNFTALERLTSQ